MRSDCPLNIVLIGMPGAGKSSIGVLLAKRLGYDFVDTDLLIQIEAHCRLQQIIVHHGLEAFKDLEERVVCKLAPHRAVIATGGSVVYSRAAMARRRRVRSRRRRRRRGRAMAGTAGTTIPGRRRPESPTRA